jgi:hypothetical protein
MAVRTRPGGGLGLSISVGPVGNRMGNRGAYAPPRKVAFEPGTKKGMAANMATHERIIRQWIGDFFTEEAEDEVVLGNIDQDGPAYQGLTPEATAAHSMMAPSWWPGGETVQDAIRLREAKLDADFKAVVAGILAGRWREARHRFGMMVHTVEDEFPHAHTADADGRRPLPWNPGDLPAVVKHVRSDESERMATPNVVAAGAATLARFEKVEKAVLGLPDDPGANFTPDQDLYLKFLRFRGYEVYSPWYPWRGTLEADLDRWKSRATRQKR